MLSYAALIGLFAGLPTPSDAANNAATVKNYQQALESRLFPQWATFWRSNEMSWEAQPGISRLQTDRYARLRNASNCTPLPGCLISA